MKTSTTVVFTLLLAQLASCRSLQFDSALPYELDSGFVRHHDTFELDSDYAHHGEPYELDYDYAYHRDDSFALAPPPKRTIALLVDAPGRLVKRQNGKSTAIVPYKGGGAGKVGAVAKAGMSKGKMGAIAGGVALGGAAIAAGVTKLVKGHKKDKQ